MTSLSHWQLVATFALALWFVVAGLVWLKTAGTGMGRSLRAVFAVLWPVLSIFALIGWVAAP